MSEALRLADALEQQFPTGTAQHYLDGEAAAELRRLHAELERKSDAIQRLWKERDELRALNAELVEALRVAVDSDLGAKWVWHETGKEAWITHARAALAKVEASK